MRNLIIAMVAMFAFLTNVNAGRNNQKQERETRIENQIHIDTNVKDSVVRTESGKWTATHYGSNYKGIRYTANGEKFNMNAMTCAAPKKFPFGTKLKVTNLANGKSVIVRVTDRGAKDLRGSVIDLTYGAFGKIAKHSTGRISIKVEVLSN